MAISVTGVATPLKPAGPQSSATIYRNDHGRTKLAVPLLGQGPAVGDRCCLIAPQGSLDRIVERLRRTKSDPDAAIERGQLLTFRQNPARLIG